MLHLYALVRRPAALPDTTGIDGTVLRAIAIDDRVEAIVSVTDAPSTPTDAAVLAHAQAVDALAASNEAVLPARFAAGVGDEGELRRKLAGRAEELAAALERVRGCTEMGLRVVPPAAADRESHASGREYMQHRLAQVSEAERLARELHDSL